MVVAERSSMMATNAGRQPSSTECTSTGCPAGGLYLGGSSSYHRPPLIGPLQGRSLATSARQIDLE